MVDDRDLRYERKFLISGLLPDQVISVIKLHPALFSEIFHRRYVNNIYFDSHDMKNYLDNIDGSSYRIKPRIRWYGDLLGLIEAPTLELKIKNGIVGTKRRFPLRAFRIDRDLSRRKIMSLIDNSNIPELLKRELNAKTPVLLNRYGRRYYLSGDNKFRVTIDTDMEFFSLDGPHTSRLVGRRAGNEIVVELKYERRMEQEVERIVNYFPFRLSKNSKYAKGISLLDLW